MDLNDFDEMHILRTVHQLSCQEVKKVTLRVVQKELMHAMEADLKKMAAFAGADVSIEEVQSVAAEISEEKEKASVERLDYIQ